MTASHVLLPFLGIHCIYAKFLTNNVGYEHKFVYIINAKFLRNGLRYECTATFMQSFKTKHKVR